MTDGTSFYPELAKEIAPVNGKLGVLLCCCPDALENLSQRRRANNR